MCVCICVKCILAILPAAAKSSCCSRLSSQSRCSCGIKATAPCQTFTQSDLMANASCRNKDVVAAGGLCSWFLLSSVVIFQDLYRKSA